MRTAVTAFAFCALLISAFALYAISYDSGRLSSDVSALADKITGTEEQIAQLRAEKANLLRPARIERLAKANLKLQPAAPGQLGKIADLPWRGEAQGVPSDAPPMALQP